uniref:Ig-like domain-containing protein n=1 Tax=Chrysolophus pictus TaxID=9089 RepID=A0A8C3L2K3_CHRPC
MYPPSFPVISTASPRIINITVSSNGDHTFKARCTAEGEPAPALTWTSPHSSNLTSVTNANHRVTKELQYLTHDGKYTCTAVNSHGRAEGSVYFYKFKASNSSFFLILIFVPLGIKVLVLLVILGLTLFPRGPSTAPSILARPQPQDSTYENFDRRCDGSHSLPTEQPAARCS